MLNPTTLFIVGLFLLFACAVLAGELMSHLGQLPLVGQLVVGIVLGPTLLGPALGLGGLSAAFSGIQILATFFILMMAGLAVTPDQVRSTGTVSVLLGIAIFTVPFVLGTAVLRLLYPGMPVLSELFVSLTLSITALPVLGVMLREFGLLESRFGAYLLNASLVNELIAVTVFAVLLRIWDGTGNVWVEAGTSVGLVALFLGTVVGAYALLRLLRGRGMTERAAAWFQSSWRSREGGFALVMAVALGAAFYSQYLGITYLIGAFYAGVLITSANERREHHLALTRALDTISWGFFIPLFFAIVGLSMNLRLLGVSWEAVAAFATLCVFAFFSKLFVGAAVTRTLGWSGNESLGAGFLLASRGAVELAMAVTLLSLHVFSLTTFTIVAGVGLVTTFLSPIGARPFVVGQPRGPTPPDGSGGTGPGPRRPSAAP
jgi:Kef-type K+ transport system membrane component KefB